MEGVQKLTGLDIQIDRQMDRQIIDKYIDGQIDRQKDRQIEEVQKLTGLDRYKIDR